jgi:PhnB protein
MLFHAYLNFDGQCAEAFRHYAELLGGKLELMSYGDSPVANEMPEGSGDRVMHAALTVGDQLLMASDAPPGRYQQPAGTYVSVTMDTIDEARRIFDGLAQSAEIQMPFEPTFWSPGFGMLVDRWGTPWMVSCAAPVEQSASHETAASS